MAPTQAAIRILLIHDRPLVRDGLSAIIDAEPGITVVGAAAKLSEAISMIAGEKPDLILFDLDREGEEDGFGFLGNLLETAQQTPILVLAGLSENISEVCSRAASLGASGVVLNQQGQDVLIKALKKVHAGEVWFDRATIGRILRKRTEGSQRLSFHGSNISSLTAREREVITLIAQGLKNKQIAAKLFISETTVAHHLSSIFSKLDISDRLELMLYALDHKLAKFRRE